MTMNDLKKRAEKIAELAAQAVPGPWIAAGPSWGADKPIWLNSVVVDTDDDSSEEVCRLRDVDDNMRDATCEFIAAAPEMAQLIADQQAEIARLRRAAKSKKCRWTQDEDYGDVYDGSCGVKWEFTEGGPTENGVNFCPRCGKPVGLRGRRRIGRRSTSAAFSRPRVARIGWKAMLGGRTERG